MKIQKLGFIFMGAPYTESHHKLDGEFGAILSESFFFSPVKHKEFAFGHKDHKDFYATYLKMYLKIFWRLVQNGKYAACFSSGSLEFAYLSSQS